MSSTEDSEDEFEVKPMSTLFQGFRFLLLPNNKSGVTQIRAKLARGHGALINRTFQPQKSHRATTHVLVDDKVLPYGSQAWRKLLEANFHEEDKHLLGLEDGKIPILTQNWMVDCVKKMELQPYDKYAIDLKVEPPSASPSPRKRKATSPLPESPLSKSQQREELLSHDIVKENPNVQTIHILSELADSRKIQGEVFKMKAYRTAIDALQRTPQHITTIQQAKKLPGVGPSIAEKIVEIARTNDLQMLHDLNNSDQVKLLRMFKGIYGVGDGFARTWIKEGMRSLDDVRSRDDLTVNQRLGLEYYDTWTEKIPRDECSVHNDYVLQVFREIDPKVEATIGGSYRRGAKFCGDIDFIVTKEGAEIEELRDILDKFMTKIKESGYWKCALNTSITTKWLGGCALTPEWNKKVTGEEVAGKCRRVDFLLVPWKEIGAAMIYFTGNNEFNKMVRFKAQKRGMNLSDKGLFKVVKNKDGEVVSQELIESFSERKIFDILGVMWVEPTSRNIGDDMIGY